MKNVPPSASSEEGSGRKLPPFVITPLITPEYSELSEISGTLNYWAILKTTVLRLGGLGVRPPQTSRLNQALETIEASSNATPGAVSASDKAVRCAMEAYRVALEFWTISRTLTPRLASTLRVKNLLQRAYMGNLDPASEDQTSERARDAQFELWLGSWFAMGGRPVRAEEPDLRVTLWFHWYGVAAKRVRSRAQLLKRVQDAADQIRTSSERGLVALSLDNYTDRSVKQAAGVGPGKDFFEGFPELDSAESWLMAKAPWVKGTLSFGLITSWSAEGTHPSVDMSALERTILLNSEKPEQQDVVEALEESRLLRQDRWRELQRFAPRAAPS